MRDHDNAAGGAVEIELSQAPKKLVRLPIDTAIASRRGKRSVNNHAVAPGVTTRQMTRKAPTVCSAATVQAASRVKNSSFRPRVFRPIERAWCSSKKVTIRSFHFSSRIAIEIKPIAASWIISSGAMARILPRMMV